jgi:hypothetical protein
MRELNYGFDKILEILECLNDWQPLRKVSAELIQLDLNYIVTK